MSCRYFLQLCIYGAKINRYFDVISFLTCDGCKKAVKYISLLLQVKKNCNATQNIEIKLSHTVRAEKILYAGNMNTFKCCISTGTVNGKINKKKNRLNRNHAAITRC